MLCSSYQLFHEELEKIKQIFTRNGFTKNFLDNCIKRFLNRKFTTTSTQQEEKQLIYVKLRLQVITVFIFVVSLDVSLKSPFLQLSYVLPLQR